MQAEKMQAEERRPEFFVDFRRPYEVSSKVLRVLGLWSRSPDSFFGANFYTVYAVSILAVCNALYAFEIAYWFFGPGSFATIASSGVVVFEKVQTNVKVFCIIRYQPMVKRLLRECNKAMFQPRTRHQAEEAKAVLRVYKYFYLSFGISAIFSVSSLSFDSLVGKGKQPVLPYVAWYPFNYTQHFWPTYCHQVLSTYVIAQTHANADCFSIGLLVFIIAQCGILSDSIRNLQAITSSLLEASGAVDQKELMLETEKQFSACVRHHKEILRWFQEVQGMLSWPIFAQYASSTLTVCMILIQATLVGPSDPKFVTMVIYATVMLGQLFLFCWWGNELIDKSSQIPVAAFESDWLEMSPRTKKELLIFAHCTQRPLEVFGADYFSVSLRNYMLILKHSYSFFAVLHQTNS